MGKAPSFQFYPSDWLRDLAEHPLEISGAWITICCHLFYSDTKGTSEKTIEKWSRILREKERKTVQIIAYLDNHNIADVVNQNGSIRITSRRMVHDEYIRKTRQFAGLQGGNPLLKTLSEKGNLVKQEVKQTTKLNTLSSSSSSSSSSLESKDIERDFKLFWKIYPRKVARKVAFTSWQKINPDQNTFKKIMCGLEAYIKSGQWNEVKFIPHPATWLNQQRWNDEIKGEQNAEDRLKSIIDVCSKPDRVARGVHREETQRRPAEIMDGEAHEISEMETGEDG
jgi:hypothetical protein